MLDESLFSYSSAFSLVLSHFVWGRKLILFYLGFLSCLVLYRFYIFNGSLSVEKMAHHSLGFEIEVTPILAIAIIFKTAVIVFPHNKEF